MPNGSSEEQTIALTKLRFKLQEGLRGLKDERNRLLEEQVTLLKEGIDLLDKRLTLLVQYYQYMEPHERLWVPPSKPK
jgi:hypothetical protein